MLLAASIAALLLGPLLFQVTSSGSRTLAFFDGFAFIAIAGLLCFGILPQAISAGGAAAWLLAGLGLLFPIGLERLFHRLARQAHMVVLLLGVAGLAVHAAIDGVALAAGNLITLEDQQNWGHLGHRHGSNYLAMAVVLHRIPLGLAVWYLLAGTLGRTVAWGVLLALIVGTLSGYALGPDLISTMGGDSIAFFQAFVAGSILHVLIYEPQHGVVGSSHPSESLARWPHRIGLICGLLLLYVYL
jgi:hypothetical protein